MINYNEWRLRENESNWWETSDPIQTLTYGLNASKDVLILIKNKEARQIANRIMRLISSLLKTQNIPNPDDLVHLDQQMDAIYTDAYGDGYHDMPDRNKAEAEAILAFSALADMGYYFTQKRPFDVRWLIYKVSHAKEYAKAKNAFNTHEKLFTQQQQVKQNAQPLQNNQDAIAGVLSKPKLSKGDLMQLTDMLSDNNLITNQDGKYVFTPIPILKGNSIKDLVNMMWSHKSHVIHAIRQL